jgi:hypothetical protein
MNVRKSEISEENWNCLHNTTPNFSNNLYSTENTIDKDKCITAWAGDPFLPSVEAGARRCRRFRQKQRSHGGVAREQKTSDINRVLAGSIATARSSRPRWVEPWRESRGEEADARRRRWDAAGAVGFGWCYFSPLDWTVYNDVLCMGYVSSDDWWGYLERLWDARRGRRVTI